MGDKGTERQSCFFIRERTGLFQVDCPLPAIGEL